MSSSGVRDEESTDSRTKKIILAREEDLVNSYKTFDEASSISSLAGGGEQSTGEGTAPGNFMPRKGIEWLGQYGNQHESITIVSGEINVSKESGASSPMLLTQPEGAVADFLDTLLQGSNVLDYQEQLIQTGTENITIRPAISKTIVNIVGTGATQIITVTLDDVSKFTLGDLINVTGTTNFNIAKTPILSIDIPLKKITYDLGSTGSATPETAGLVVRGNIRINDDLEIITTPNSITHFTFDNIADLWSLDYSTVAIVAPSVAKNNNLGNLTGAVPVNFNFFDDRQLYGNQVGLDVNITFTNGTPNISLNLKIYMTPAQATGSLIVEGTTIFSSGSDPFSIKPLATNDFLSIEVESVDGVAYTIISVKKNDDSGGGDVAPGLPVQAFAIGNSATTINVNWGQPPTGTLPITYTAAWSLSPTETAGAPFGPLTPLAPSPVSGLLGPNFLITGLTAATTYYVWIRAVNAVGSSNYVGPLQTNTDGTSNPGGVNFAIPGATVFFNSITITWDQPSALRFTLTREDPDTSITVLQEFSIADTDIVDTFNIEATLQYKYRLQTFNEFGVQLGEQTITLNAAALPIPVLALAIVSRKLQFTVTIPAGINICQVDWDITNAFGATTVTIQMLKTVAKGTPQAVVFTTQELNISTKYFVRARFQLNANNGGYNATQDIITGTLSVPQKPEIDNSISGDSRGVMKIGVDFLDSVSVGETGVCTVRATASVGEYFPFSGNNWSRDNKPIDNIASPSQEDEILVPRAGGGWGAIGIITVVSGAVDSIAITNGGNNYTSGQTVRIWDDDDAGGGNGTFEGTAIVSGGQLTGVTIVNGGDFYNDGNVVFLPATSPDPNISALFVAGGSMTARLVATNDAGSSESDTETVQVNGPAFAAPPPDPPKPPPGPILPPTVGIPTISLSMQGRSSSRKTARISIRITKHSTSKTSEYYKIEIYNSNSRGRKDKRVQAITERGSSARSDKFPFMEYHCRIMAIRKSDNKESRWSRYSTIRLR